MNSMIAINVQPEAKTATNVALKDTTARCAENQNKFHLRLEILIYRQASAPTNTKDLHSFFCSVTWSSRFMKNFCTMAEPLWRLTKNGVKWQWGEIEQRAFEDIKQAISTKCIGFFKKDWDTSLMQARLDLEQCSIKSTHIIQKNDK